MTRDVLVVVGAGGMGLAGAQRLGFGRTVLLADVDEGTLAHAAEVLALNGIVAQTRMVDVTSAQSVAELAAEAASLGPVRHVVHTAGVSPEQASVETILAVDVLGVAHVLEQFGDAVACGGSGVVVSSVAGHVGLRPLSPEGTAALTTSRATDLLGLPFLAPDDLPDTQTAYGLAKACNHQQVRAAARTWGRRGARINSVSPGVIATAMGRQELAGTYGEIMQAVVDASPAGRLGTPYDVADAVAFLLGPQAEFVTGTDLLVDGGWLPTMTLPPLTDGAAAAEEPA